MVRCRSFGVICSFVAAVLAFSGCRGKDRGDGGEDAGTLRPVSGKVLLGDTGLTYGQVAFVPDTKKGNKATVSPMAKVGANGSYQIETDGRLGAPEGWYKVTVVTNDPSAPDNAPVIPHKYSRFDLTDLSVEVTANPAPGSYDFRLNKR